jgi:hypothetical protein
MGFWRAAMNGIIASNRRAARSRVVLVEAEVTSVLRKLPDCDVPCDDAPT